MAFFGLGGKGSPSKNPRKSSSNPRNTSYTADNSPHAPHHFFSFPLWKRNNMYTFPAQNPHTATDDFGGLSKQSSFDAKQRNDRPPTIPPKDRVSSTIIPRISSISCDDDGQEFITGSSTTALRDCTPPRRRPDPPTHSATVLAQASLGLGLPHVMPHQGASSSSLDITTLRNVYGNRNDPDTGVARSIIRKAKSFQKIRQDPPTESPQDLRHRRRSRGLSLGPLHFEIESKGKEREPESPAKGVSRKSSFWRRRKDSTKTVLYPEPEKSLPPVPSPPADRKGHVHIQPPIPPTIINDGSDRNGASGLSLGQPSTPKRKALLRSRSTALQRSHSDRMSPGTRPSSAHGPSPHAASKSSELMRPLKRPSTAGALPSGPRSAQLAPSVSFSSITPQPITDRADSFPLDPTKPRPRASTNPPLFHRLSMNLFSSSPPVPALPHTQLTGSPDASTFSSPRPSTSKQSVDIPKPRMDEESSKQYVDRLADTVPKSDVAAVLASSGEPFYVEALKYYFSQFSFKSDPLDVALRKLLMHVGLPRETQQIDRVIESFSVRYSQCNPGLIVPQDNAYILAFSLIMLHTDAFNKSNKHKMTKADYIKNTSLPGVAPEVLDCFYDNIVFAPFIFIEDPLDLNSTLPPSLDGAPSRRGSTFASPNVNPSAGTSLLKSNRIDPYYLIIRNELDPLRVNVESAMPLANPYTFRGPTGDAGYEEIHEKFLRAWSADLNMETSLVSPSFFAIPSPMLPTGSGNDDGAPAHSGCVVKLVKIGILNRKDDTMEGGKRAIARKWKVWGAVVTHSQLLFYRDAAQVMSIRRRFEESVDLPPPRMVLARPDELWSLKDTSVVLDGSYTKRDHVVRFVMADGRQSLFQVESEEEKYEWMACMNYGSSFKTAGVGIRSAGMTKKDIELTGIAAAASHLRDLEMNGQGSPPLKTWDRNGLPRRPRVESLNPAALRRYSETSETEPMSPRSDSSSIQVKNTFDIVKADLANITLESPSSFSRTHSLDLASTLSAVSKARHPHGKRSTRTRTIENRIKEIESQLSETRSKLRSDLLLVRNVAVLTPFQRTTRDRLYMAILNISKRVNRLRLEETKLLCHRDILTHDLLTADLSWQRTKETALNAAKEVLRVRSFSLTEIDVIDESKPSIAPLPISIPLSRSFSGDSFHSLPDNMADSPVIPSPSPFTSHILESPASAQSSSTRAGVLGQPSASSTSFHMERTTGDSTRTSFDHVIGQENSPGGLHTHERFHTAPEISEEQAEEWNKTKAAKRVSLVRVPNDLRMLLPVRTPEEVHLRLRASPNTS
ncbi:hypothetical protein BJ322DRAFT_1107883 [Thelephora terrestris]|uniref:SEC7 domain-containing protein n=1 Tax=Thelephora terrestris TaxID=56493 RepID=A0A9P6HFR5_9AGAM|nr:hypothetical protein BJ322DRAFT_1107883 [Thelephora terrestris]